MGSGRNQNDELISEKSEDSEQPQCVLLASGSHFACFWHTQATTLDGVWHDVLRFAAVELTHTNPKMFSVDEISLTLLPFA